MAGLREGSRTRPISVRPGKTIMGIYRLLLAILVAISHAGISFYDYNPGVVAVISFYILSGYVMSMLIGKYYKRPSVVPTFYLDRAVRLFPQFVFYTILSSILIYFLKLDSPFLNTLNIYNWWLNFLMLPQAFYMFWPDAGWLVIPQSWSLGLEVTFYLVIPWILIYFSKRQVYTLACASFCIFLAAYFGIINSDFYGYRLLPGTLFMFIVGWSFFQNDSDSRKFRIIVLFSAGALLLIALLNESLYQMPYNKEVLVGLMIGILAVSTIRRFSFSNLDEFLGNLS